MLWASRDREALVLRRTKAQRQREDRRVQSSLRHVPLQVHAAQWVEPEADRGAIASAANRNTQG